MKIDFYLRFHTEFGQLLSITGNIQELGNNVASEAKAMQYLNDEFWHAVIEVDTGVTDKFHYKYALTYADGFQVTEGEQHRVIDVKKTGIPEIQIIDAWNEEGFYENVYFTSPFKKVLLAENETTVKLKPVKSFTHIFKVKAPLLKKNEVLFVTGSSLALGNWNKDGALLMAKEGSWWIVKVNMPHEGFPLNYKYGVYNTKQKDHLFLESGADRYLHGNASASSLSIIHDGFAHLPANGWRGAGTAIPVFSLKTKNSFGTGEFADLMLLADWAKEVGLKLIQILPVNDTSATFTSADSYPYAAISAMALHPLYINLDKVAGKKNAGTIKHLKKKQKQLNDLPELDYEQVIKLKLSALNELFAAQKEELVNDADFNEFYHNNRHWLAPYAAFCNLRDKNSTADFSKWKMFSKYDKVAIEKYVSPKAKHHAEILFHYFIQYHLHLQLKEATDYARKKGVIVKGDIPIGIYRHSCDAWMSPELYDMDMQAGAPPDDFAVKGQNWGFPIYNWQKMQENSFAWWRHRFEQMSYYFDAFRIDHILGFFRIWSIPTHAVEGIMGYFLPSIPVNATEFRERDIAFNHTRYTIPFISDNVLNDVFAEDAEAVKQEFLEDTGNHQYTLKEEFNTQRKIEAYFNQAGHNEKDNTIKTGLFDLISNVILFEVPGSEGKQFYFRISMNNTSSFKYLDHHTQNALKELYIDYFYRRQDAFWKLEAIKKLPALKASTNMLICGEDLGMVPHSVPVVMKQLGILSLEIQRMPKDPNREFFHPADAPYLSVITPSTHDMSTIRGWWQEDKNKTQRFFNDQLGQWGEAPVKCEAWINKAILLQHLHSPAMWSIFQLQDILGMSDTLRRENPDEERINVPAISDHYWRYRMHVTLEDLLKEKAFNNELKHYVHASGR